MAVVYLQRNEVESECMTESANVPNNDVARLMYYSNCVCFAIDCNNDNDIQRFTNYQNWARLLFALCYKLSPDVFEGKVFFNCEEFCVQFPNEFYKISQVRHQLVAAESIIIAGRTRRVNKIMTYKMQWMEAYYLGPMRRIAAAINSRPRPPPPAVHYAPPAVQQPERQNKSLHTCCCICTCCCCVVIIVIVIVVVGHTHICMIDHEKVNSFATRLEVLRC